MVRQRAKSAPRAPSTPGAAVVYSIVATTHRSIIVAATKRVRRPGVKAVCQLPSPRTPGQGRVGPFLEHRVARPLTLPLSTARSLCTARGTKVMASAALLLHLLVVGASGAEHDSSPVRF